MTKYETSKIENTPEVIAQRFDDLYEAVGIEGFEFSTTSGNDVRFSDFQRFAEGLVDLSEQGMLDLEPTPFREMVNIFLGSEDALEHVGGGSYRVHIQRSAVNQSVLIPHYAGNRTEALGKHVTPLMNCEPQFIANMMLLTLSTLQSSEEPNLYLRKIGVRILQEALDIDPVSAEDKYRRALLQQEIDRGEYNTFLNDFKVRRTD